jgi:hypothetical protein
MWVDVLLTVILVEAVHDVDVIVQVNECGLMLHVG